MKKKSFIAIMLIVVSLCSFFGGPKTTYASAEERDEIYYGAGVFAGAAYQYSETQTFTYDHRTIEEKHISYGMPKYSEASNRENTCANIAGMTLLGFYDRLYPNLIPNFTAGRAMGTRYFYSAQSTAVNNVMTILYDKMKTNTTGPGSTSANARNGLISYVNDMGYDMAFGSVVSSGNTNYNAVKKSINVEIPLMYFVKQYNLTAINEDDNYQIDSNHDRIEMNIYQGYHVLIVYGYMTINYYNASNNLIKQHQFLRVASGIGIDPFVYILMTDRTIVVEGYTANIY